MSQIHAHDLGLSWVEENGMARAAHALRDDGRVWLIDPFADAEALEHAAALGPPAGVLQLLDRHGRDCATIAQRLGVPHLRLPEALSDAPFVPRRVIRNPLWKEVALWWPAQRALIVAEVLGSAPAWTLDAAPVGVHPLRRLMPPGNLAELDPEHLLMGHGAPLHGPQTAADMRAAIDGSRGGIPRLVVKLPGLLKAAR